MNKELAKCDFESCIIKTDSPTGYCSIHERYAMPSDHSAISAPEDLREESEENEVSKEAIAEPSVTISEAPAESLAIETIEKPVPVEASYSRQELRLVAIQPSEMEAAQKDLVAWGHRRLTDEREKNAELQENYDTALERKWRSEPLKKLLKISIGRVTAFEKIVAALEDGYVIIPDFPVTMIAIRTSKEMPLNNYKSSEYCTPQQPEQKAQLLAAGAGNYKSPKPEIHRRLHQWTDREGVNHNRYSSEATSFQDFEFPFMLAKPAVLDATARAMTNKVFDEIGVAPDAAIYQKTTRAVTGSHAPDPMIIGRIHVPVRPGKTRVVSFMIAWFLDESMLP